AVVLRLSRFLQPHAIPDAGGPALRLPRHGHPCRRHDTARSGFRPLLDGDSLFRAAQRRRRYAGSGVLARATPGERPHIGQPAGRHGRRSRPGPPWQAERRHPCLQRRSAHAAGDAQCAGPALLGDRRRWLAARRDRAAHRRADRRRTGAQPDARRSLVRLAAWRCRHLLRYRPGKEVSGMAKKTRTTGQPKVSVITSTYREVADGEMENGRDSMLARAVDSVRAQTLVDWELWVVADCPPPEDLHKIEQLLASYEDDRIHLAVTA